MADDKTTKTPGQPVTDTGPDKETPPAPPKEPEKVSVSPEPEKKTEPEVKNPQVSVYNFAEIMKEKKVEERAAAPSGEKSDPAKAEKPEKQPEAPKKAEEKPKEPEQPKRRGRPPKADKDKAATPKPEAPAQKPENAVKKEPEKKTAPTVQAAPAPKESEKPKDAPRRGKEQIVYIKLNELHAFKNHPFEVRDDEEMRAMVSSVKDKGVTQPAIVRPREDGGYLVVCCVPCNTIAYISSGYLNTQHKAVLITGSMCFVRKLPLMCPFYKHSAVRVGFGHRFLNRSSSGTSFIFVIIVIVDFLTQLFSFLGYLFAKLFLVHLRGFGDLFLLQLLFIRGCFNMCSVDKNHAWVYHPVVQCFVQNMCKNFFTQLRGKAFAKGITYRCEMRDLVQ